MDIEKCRGLCYTADKDFFGVKNGNQCWCGDNEPGEEKKLPADQCSAPCAGNPKEFCGGLLTINVFQVDKSKSAS